MGSVVDRIYGPISRITLSCLCSRQEDSPPILPLETWVEIKNKKTVADELLPWVMILKQRFFVCSFSCFLWIECYK